MSYLRFFIILFSCIPFLAESSSKKDKPCKPRSFSTSKKIPSIKASSAPEITTAASKVMSKHDTREAERLVNGIIESSMTVTVDDYRSAVVYVGQEIILRRQSPKGSIGNLSYRILDSQISKIRQILMGIPRRHRVDAESKEILSEIIKISQSKQPAARAKIKDLLVSYLELAGRNIDIFHIKNLFLAIASILANFKQLSDLLMELTFETLEKFPASNEYFREHILSPEFHAKAISEIYLALAWIVLEKKENKHLYRDFLTDLRGFTDDHASPRQHQEILSFIAGFDYLFEGKDEDLLIASQLAHGVYISANYLAQVHLFAIAEKAGYENISSFFETSDPAMLLHGIQISPVIAEKRLVDIDSLLSSTAYGKSARLIYSEIAKNNQNTLLLPSLVRFKAADLHESLARLLASRLPLHQAIEKFVDDPPSRFYTDSLSARIENINLGVYLSDEQIEKLLSKVNGSTPEALLARKLLSRFGLDSDLAFSKVLQLLSPEERNDYQLRIRMQSFPQDRCLRLLRVYSDSPYFALLAKTFLPVIRGPAAHEAALLVFERSQMGSSNSSLKDLPELNHHFSDPGFPTYFKSVETDYKDAIIFHLTSDVVRTGAKDLIDQGKNLRHAIKQKKAEAYQETKRTGVKPATSEPAVLVPSRSTNALDIDDFLQHPLDFNSRLALARTLDLLNSPHLREIEQGIKATQILLDEKMKVTASQKTLLWGGLLKITAINPKLSLRKAILELAIAESSSNHPYLLDIASSFFGYSRKYQHLDLLSQMYLEGNSEMKQLAKSFFSELSEWLTEDGHPSPLMISRIQALHKTAALTADRELQDFIFSLIAEYVEPQKIRSRALAINQAKWTPHDDDLLHQLPEWMLTKLRTNLEAKDPAVSISLSEAGGMYAALIYEMEAGRFPIDLSTTKNLGYDIWSVDFKTGEIRRIEAKGKFERAKKEGIPLSPNELYQAEKEPDGYFVYVTDIATDTGKVAISFFTNFSDQTKLRDGQILCEDGYLTNYYSREGMSCYQVDH